MTKAMHAVTLLNGIFRAENSSTSPWCLWNGNSANWVLELTPRLDKGRKSHFTELVQDFPLRISATCI